MTNLFIEQLSDKIMKNREFRTDYEEAIKSQLNQTEENKLTKVQIKRLIETASIFSLHDDMIFKKLALKISYTLILKYGFKHNHLYSAAEIIFSRLGDFPTVQYMHNQNSTKKYSKLEDSFLYNSLVFPEIFLKKVKNQYKIKSQELLFTDFQTKVFFALKNGKNISLSAPPSAGKSYIIHNYVADGLISKSEYIVVYIVPTKALIADVQSSVISILKNTHIDFNTITILNSTERFNATQTIFTKKIIFILTQERLDNLLKRNFNIHVDLIIVDEAQKIEEDMRGTILENTVNYITSNNPNVQTIIISPLMKNPEKFLDIFNVHQNKEKLSTESTPVGQNIFYINFCGKQIHSSLLLQDITTSSNTEHDNLITLDNKHIEKIPRKKYEKTAMVVKKFLDNKDQTLIYCDRPIDCTNTANILVKNVEENKISKNLELAIDFIKTNVHPDYFLIDHLRSKIGFHHGKMQQFIKFTVEKLFKDKEISQLCCTSTLLEGVNLPAKNIVINNPRRGRAMEKLDIMNLVGRAGRFSKDYFGNVYCIDIATWPTKNVFDGSLLPVISATDKIFQKAIPELIQHLMKYSEPNNPKYRVTNVATNLIIKYIKSEGNIILEDLKEKYPNISSADMNKIEENLCRIKNETSDLDQKIISKNRIDPRLAHDLYVKIKSKKIIYPVYPDHIQFDKNLEKIFKLLKQYIIKDLKHKDLKYYSHIASNWIKQKTYSEIIKGGLEFHSSVDKIELEDNSEDIDILTKNKKKINKRIEQINDILEITIKFKLARAVQCYCDLIEDIVEQEDLKPEHKINFQLADQLESGAYEQHVLLLLELGVSRDSAIIISKNIKDEILDTHSMYQWLDNNRTEIKSILHPYMYKEFEFWLGSRENVGG